jgi:uncharacterized protein (TIGR02246 family)
LTNDFLLAECAIRQLHAGFVDIAWRQDADRFAKCFTEDGEWKIAGMVMKGRDEIRSTFAKLLGACEKVWLNISPPLITLDGNDRAVSRTHATEYARMKEVAGGGNYLTFGIYYDRYARVDGKWLFSARHFGLQYRGPVELPEPWVDGPDFGPPPNMPAPDAPTFTRRKQV